MKAVRVAMVFVFVTGMIAAAGPARAAEPATISGVVTAEGGRPLRDVCVDAWSAVDHYVIDAAYTADDGVFTLTVDPDDASAVLVRFQDCGYPRRFAPEWYDDAPDRDGAQTIEIEDGSEVGGIDAELGIGGAIGGRVTNETGDPLANVCVDVLDAAREEYASGAFTDQQGRFLAGGLQTGSYRVRFNECPIAVPIDKPVPRPVPYPGPEPQSHATLGYVTEWYHDASSFSAATDVPVTLGALTSGIDEDLELAGGISGSVVAEDGTSVGNVCVEAYDHDGNWVDTAVTDGFGSYLLARLRPGEIRVLFADCEWGRFVAEWYEDEHSFIAADPVIVNPGVLTRDIDAALMPRPVPDLAVTALEVRRVPLQVDRGPAAPVGWSRQVDVTVENLGNRGSVARVEAWVRYETGGAIRRLGVASARLEPGARLQRAFDWNGLGSAGDATVFARVCESPLEYNLANNARAVKSFVLAGGTGIGVAPFSGRGFSSPCYDGPIIVEEGAAESRG